ncbi:MAG: hypothetical protein ABMA02_02445 [Saprospiraceae bacterium]
MKKTVTLLTFSAKWTMLRAVLLVLVSTFFCSLAGAQGIDLKTEIGDLTAIVWKPTSGIELVVADETAKMDIALSPTDLEARDQALYRSYQRLLGHILTAVQGGKPVDEAIYIGYEKVLEDINKVPGLQEIPEGVLITYIPGLVESLTEPNISGN